MKNSLFRIGKEISFAFLGVMVAGALLPIVGHVFMRWEGAVIVASAVWLTLHKIAQSPDEIANQSSTVARLRAEESGQDIAEYAVMLAVILVLVVSTVKLIGSNANSVFSQVASSIESK